MKKKTIIILLVLLLCLCVVFIPHKKDITVTLEGYCFDIGNESNQHPAQITINGSALFHLFSVKAFNGTIEMRDSVHPIDKQSIYILFGDDGGIISSYNKAGNLLSYDHIGSICTSDFTELLIIFYDDNSQTKHHQCFVGPVSNADQISTVAQKLSKGTVWSDVIWQSS